jgi:hypothetical protein
MAAPTLDQTRTAASGIHSMAEADFVKRRSAEAGDALVAFFVILAKKLFPKDKEPLTAARVELMLAAYFLRGEVDHKAAKPPSEAAAKKAIDLVSSLDGAALDQRITDEIGDAVLAFFSAFSGKVIPGIDPDSRAKTVQLMVLAYLARRELQEAAH